METTSRRTFLGRFASGLAALAGLAGVKAFGALVEPPLTWTFVPLLPTYDVDDVPGDIISASGNPGLHVGDTVVRLLGSDRRIENWTVLYELPDGSVKMGRGEVDPRLV